MGRNALAMPFKPFNDIESEYYLLFTLSIRLFILTALDSYPDKVLETYELMEEMKGDFGALPADSAPLLKATAEKKFKSV